MKRSRHASPVDAWFSTFEDAGEDIFIRFGRLQSRASDPEWLVVSHIGTDGIGAFGAHLRKAGYAGVDLLPRMRNKERPSTARVLRRIFELLAQKDVGPHAKLATGAARPARAATVPTSIGWYVFDRTQTKELIASAQNRRVTLNSLLLASLDQAFRSGVDRPEACMRWVVPVNMRGGVDLADDTANHVSSIEVALTSDDSVGSVHEKIKDCLTRLDHWAIWHGYAIVGRVGAKGRSWLLKHQQRIKPPCFGAFSNLGDWDPKHPDPGVGESERWLVVPTGTRDKPVTAGSMVVNGCLSLTVTIHPEVSDDPELAEGFVRRWVEELSAPTRTGSPSRQSSRSGP
jgi:hypothetical protein